MTERRCPNCDGDMKGGAAVKVGLRATFEGDYEWIEFDSLNCAVHWLTDNKDLRP